MIWSLNLKTHLADNAYIYKMLTGGLKTQHCANTVQTHVAKFAIKKSRVNLLQQSCSDPMPC